MGLCLLLTRLISGIPSIKDRGYPEQASGFPSVYSMIAAGRNGFLLLLVLMTGTQLRGASFTLEWDPSPSPQVAGYYLFCSLLGAPESVRLDPGRITSAIVDNLASGRAYIFYVAAYDTNGNQSKPSNFVIWSDADGKFVQSDIATRGNWKGVYGSEGFSMVG